MRKFIQKLHLWLGLTAGLFIFISCLTGAILVFQDEIRELSYPERYFRPEAQGRAPLPLDKLIPRIEAQLEGAHVEAIQVDADTTRNYIATPSKPGRTQLFIDPYTGEITGRTDRKTPDFFSWTMRLHRWLLDDSRTWGKQIMGASTILFVLILISGIVFWWPKTVKQLKARLTVKTSQSRYRLWSDLHASLGIYAVSLLLVMALTGLTWSYPWYRSGLYSLLGISEAQSPRPGQPERPERPAGPSREAHTTPEDNEEQVSTFPWESAYQQLRQQAGVHKYIRIEGEGKASVGAKITIGNPRQADNYQLDPKTGAILKVTPYAEQPASARARGWIYALHVGSWAGMWSKVPYFIVCLLGASFPITGVYLWWQKRSRRKR